MIPAGSSSLMRGLAIVPADAAGWQRRTAAAALGLALGLALTAAVLKASGAAPLAAMLSLALGAAGGTAELADTLRHATPLMLTGLATAIAYRAKYWTLGQEGQLIVGALFAYLLTLWLPEALPRPFAWLLPVLAAGVAGAAWSMLACWLRTRFQTSEIISTMMLNYIALHLLSYLVGGPLAQAGSTYLETAEVRDSVLLPLLNAESGLTAATPIALLLAVTMWAFMRWSPLGFEIRAVGESPRVAERKGISLAQTYALVAILSGVLAGACGAMLLLGGQPRLSTGLSSGIGYAGVIIAMLAQLKPLRVILAALLFGGLESGGAIMQLEAGVSSSIVHVVQALFLISFLVAETAVRHRITWVRRHA